MDDEALVQLWLSGDGSAFEALVLRHQSGLYGLALRMLGDREEAYDALQDSTLKAWRSASLRGGSFRGWMNAIVARTCVDRIRSRRPQSSLDDSERQVIQLPDPTPGPESMALENERARAVERALQRLTAEHRAMILLRDLSGLTYEEIAASLRLPMGTVRSRIARARLALQSELLAQDPTILEAMA